MNHRAFVSIAAIAVALGCGSAFGGGSDDRSPVQRLKIARSFAVVEPFAHAGADFGKPSSDLSGLACAGDGSERCLAIDDEGRSAQFFVIDGGKLKPEKDTVTLIAEDARAKILGREPALGCPKKEVLFEDLDGEGVAYDAAYYYVVGSHGCSRKKGKAAVSAFVTARVKPNGGGLETTYRLADVLRLADKTSFATTIGNKDNPTANGMNVEGVAVSGGTLYAGLRAPASESALIVGASISDLFKAGGDAYAGSPMVSRLRLPKDTGIRDLAALAGGRMLILTGPTREEDVPYSLYVAPLSNLADVTLLGSLELPTKDAKAEGVLPISVDEGQVEVLVVFDGVPNGAPSVYEVPLPK